MGERATDVWRRWMRDPFRRAGVALVAASAAAALGGAAWRSFSLARETRARTAALAKGPLVQTALARMSAPRRRVTLIAELRPYETVTLYAKVGGYLDEVSADKGDRVRKDQVLAVIQSPETDKEYDAALADAANKKRIADRYKPLLARKLVSDQEAEQAFAAADIARARLEQASVMKGYERILAPFDGVVTARYADPRALLQDAANSQTSALPVFTVSTADRLRATFFIDQKDAPFVRAGTPVEIFLAERPEARVRTRVTRVAGQLDENTRTMLAEAEIDNRDGRFVPGSFAQATLDISAAPQLEVPVEALVSRGAGLAVPVVSGGVVHFRPVVVDDDDGRAARVVSGLAPGDVVALNLGNSVDDGGRVSAEAPRP